MPVCPCVDSCILMENENEKLRKKIEKLKIKVEKLKLILKKYNITYITSNFIAQGKRRLTLSAYTGK